MKRIGRPNLVPGKTSKNEKLSWRADFQAVRDFKTFETINTLRMKSSILKFQQFLVIGTFTAIALGTFITVSGLSLLRQTLPADRSTVLLVGLLIILYLSASLVFVETFSNRKLAVSGSAHLELLRSLDVPLQHVVIRWGLIPCLRRLSVVSYLSLMFIALFADRSDLYLQVVIVTCGALLLTGTTVIFIVLRFATTTPQQPRLSGLTIVFTLTSGYLLGRLASAIAAVITSVEPHIDSGLLTVIIAGTGIAAALFSMMSIRLWRCLEYRRLLISRNPTSAHPVWKPQRAASLVVAILFKELFSSKQGSVIVTSLTIWLTILGTLIGASELLPLQVNIPPEQLSGGQLGLSIILSLGVIEPALQRIGPTAKLYYYYFRFLWDNGSGYASRILAPLAIYSIVGTVIGGFISSCFFLLLGSWSPVALLSGLITSLSAVLADVLARAPLTTDRTKAADITDALLTMILLAPLAFTVTLDPQTVIFVLSG